MWELEKILDGLNKTHKNQTEANDEVWAMICETEKALETLAILHGRFEKVSQRFGEICLEFDKWLLEMQDALEWREEAQRFAEFAAQMVYDGRIDYHRLCEKYGAAEHERGAGLYT